MPPLRRPAKTVLEAVHVEHAEVAHTALGDLIGRDAAEVADVAECFRRP